MSVYIIYKSGKKAAEYNDEIGRFSIINNGIMEQLECLPEKAKMIMNYIMRQYISGGCADSNELMINLDMRSAKDPNRPSSTIANSLKNIRDIVKNTELEGFMTRTDHALASDFHVEINDGAVSLSTILSWTMYRQSIIDESGNAVVESTADLKDFTLSFVNFILDKKTPVRHSLLCGNGGMGKTFLLSGINNIMFAENSGGEYFDHVYTVSLSELLNEAMNQVISDRPHESQLDRSSSDSNYLFRHFGIQYFNPKGTYLFLLDGYNEMMDRKTSQNFSIIEQIQDEISCLNIEGTYVVVTTRNKTDKKYFSEDYKLLALSELEEMIPKIDFDCKISDEAKKEITDLLKRPLFYSQYRKGGMKEIGSVENVFDLFQTFHNNAYKQSCEEKSTTDKSPYLVLYYIIAPYFAYEIDRTRDDHIDKTDALSIITDWLNRKQEIIYRIKEITGKDMNQINISDDPSFYWDLLKEFDFGELSGEIFRFSHQEWGDYFAAFYIVCSLKCIDFIALDKLPSFNLKSSTQYYVMNAFDIEKSYDPEFIPIRRKNYKELFYKELTDDIFRKPSLTKLKMWITRLYAAYSFNDHFMLHYLQQMNEIDQPFCDVLMEHPEVLKQSGLDTVYLDALIGIFVGIIQYHRIDNEYRKCREYYEFAEKYLCYKDMNPMLKNYLIHQKGKALVFCAQYYYTKGKMPEELWYDDMEPKEMFDTGISLMESCLPYNMSANLLGAIYSVPTMWILKNKLAERDVVKAYNFYNEAYMYLTKNYFLPEGTELIYTARMLLGLLLKGYVQLENGEPVASGIGNTIPNKDSLAYAKEILSHINGQDYYHVDWLRGIYYYYDSVVNKQTSESKALEEALPFFAKEKDYMLTLIIFLMKYFPGSFDKAFYQKIKKETGYRNQKNVKYTLYNVCTASKKTRIINMICSQTICESADAIYHFYDAVNLIDNIRAIEEKKGEFSKILITIDEILSLNSLINAVLNNPDNTESVEKLKKALINLFEKDIVKPY